MADHSQLAMLLSGMGSPAGRVAPAIGAAVPPQQQQMLAQLLAARGGAGGMMPSQMGMMRPGMQPGMVGPPGMMLPGRPPMPPAANLSLPVQPGQPALGMLGR